MADQKIVSKFLLIGLAIVVLAILVTQYNYNGKKTVPRETFANASNASNVSNTSNTSNTSNASNAQPELETASSTDPVGEVMPSEPTKNETYRSVTFDSPVQQVNSCAPKDKLTAEDLLPSNAANTLWAQVNPAGQGDVGDQNYLTAGYLNGINTVGQSLRNPNLQLRSDPPIDRTNVGPWNQTTIEYDASRRFFEIGDC
jgi:cytoskeletal protein RodZ